MSRRKQLTIATPEAERQMLVDALAVANLRPAELADSELLKRILHSLSVTPWDRSHVRNRRPSSVVIDTSIRKQHRKLTSALHTIAQGDDLESEEVSIPISKSRREVHFDRAADIWISFTVIGGKLVATTAPVVTTTFPAWVAYALVIASSARWKDRHGASIIAECIHCETLYMKPRRPKGGRPPTTCGKQSCIDARRMMTAR